MIFGRRVNGIAPRHTGVKKRLGAIRCHGRDVPPIGEMTRIRIDRHDFSGRLGIETNLPNEFWAQKSFTIVFKNDRVDLRQRLSHTFGDSADLLRRRRADLFAIDAHDLLMSGDDASFNDGPEVAPFYNTVRVDAPLPK